MINTKGELTFILPANKNEDYAFKLLTADGKCLAAFPHKTYHTGENKTAFNNVHLMGKMVYVTAIGQHDQKTRGMFASL